MLKKKKGGKQGCARTCATDTLLLTDGPELVEGGGTLDRGLVDTLGAVDIVGAAVTADGAEPLGAGGGVVGAEGLDDVVLDQRALGPAVHGQVAVDVSAVPGAVVADDTGRARLPTLAGDEVVDIVPLLSDVSYYLPRLQFCLYCMDSRGVLESQRADPCRPMETPESDQLGTYGYIIRATWAVVVADAALTVSPERVEKSVVYACSGRSPPVELKRRGNGSGGRGQNGESNRSEHRDDTRETDDVRSSEEIRQNKADRSFRRYLCLLALVTSQELSRSSSVLALLFYTFGPWLPIPRAGVTLLIHQLDYDLRLV
jgi:hypothetical protein